VRGLTPEGALRIDPVFEVKMNSVSYLKLTVLVLLLTASAFSQKESEIGFVYLSDLDWEVDAMQYHDVGVGVDHPWNAPDLPLSIEGVTYGKGLGLMAGWGPSYLIYNLSGQFIRLEAVVGIDDSCLILPESGKVSATFEWVLVTRAGNWIRQYRGCEPPAERKRECSDLDTQIPYWPGPSDLENEYVEMYRNQTPDTLLVMTRPACLVEMSLDGQVACESGNLTVSERYRSPAKKVELNLIGKKSFRIDVNGDGIQYGPFEEPTRVGKCPWRDYVDLADAKLYYRKSVNGVKILDTNSSVSVGEKVVLNYEVLPSNAIMDRVKVASSDPGVISIGAGGVLSAESPGTARISVRTWDGGYVDSITVAVTEK